MTIQSALKGIILFLYLLETLCSSQPIIAIQDSRENYFLYMPLTNCNPQASLVPGKVEYELLDAVGIFNSLEELDSKVFWGAMGGQNMLLVNQDKLLQDVYTQVVYYNSSVTIELESREFILVKFTQEGNIILDVATGQYTNGTIIPSIVETFVTNFTAPQLNYIMDCQTKGANPTLTFIGNYTFLVLCPNSMAVFTFGLFNPQIIEYLFSEAMAAAEPNPDLLLPQPTINYQWNAGLLPTSEDNSWYCNFTTSGVTCQDFQQQEIWMSDIVGRLWALQMTNQQQNFLNLLQETPSLIPSSFTGNVISIYKKDDNLFVESMLNDQTHLLIFASDKQIINTTLLGPVAYYGDDSLIIKASNGSYMLATFLLPYLTFSNHTNSNIASQTFQCEDALYVVNSSIMWTSFDYPSSIVIPLNQTVKVSEQGIYTSDLKESFQVVGPDFQVFLQTNSSLQIALLTSPIYYVNQRIIAVLDVYMLDNNLPQYGLLIYFLNNLGEFKVLSGSQPPSTVSKHPCGFQTVHKAKKVGSRYLISDGDGGVCSCQSKMKNCQNQQTNGITSQRSLQSNKKNYDIPSNEEESLALLKDSSAVVVEVGGNVSLQTIKGQIIASIPTNCSSEGQALIFKRQFYDDSLLILCDGASSLTQYIIRSNMFIFNRQIPLYGFIIRSNSSHIAGINYVFIEVEVDPQWIAPTMWNEKGECCVLRIDPTAYTVSAMVQIVQALEVVFVESLLGVDIAYYNRTSIRDTSPYLKIYFSSTWISFSGSPICNNVINPCPPHAFQYILNFGSIIYNFAASFPQEIIFDLTDSSIAVVPPTFTLTLQLVSGPDPYHNAIQNFNMSWVCGPLSSFNVKVDESVDPGAHEITSLMTNKVITKNKALSSFNSLVLQVVNLGNWLPQSNFKDLIMVIETSTISFFTKYTTQWLQLQLSQQTSADNCLYFLYANLNSSAAQFASNCFNLKSSTPFFTLLYNDSAGTFYVDFTSLQYPIQLKNVISFTRKDHPPLVLGLKVGPPSSATGSLIICQVQCGSLTFTNKFNFLIDFDAVEINNEVVVVGLDDQTLSIWLNPSPPKISGQLQKATHQIKYFSLTGQACNTITILQLPFSNQATLILGCMVHYFQMELQLPNAVFSVVRTYLKFSNCDSGSNNKPIYEVEGSDIVVLIVQCLNNQHTVQTQEYQTINSSSVTIQTAYLQVYTPTGPNCQGSWAPIRIIPLAVTHDLKTYVLYSANNSLKLLYEQMSGYLIDSFVDIQPFTQLSLTQLTRIQTYPKLTLSLNNPYYFLQFPVTTLPAETQPSLIAQYITQAIFIAVNLLTLLFLICWIVFKRKTVKKKNKLNSSATGSDRDDTPQNTILQSSSNGRASSSRMSHPQPLRRVTEIQLFQPRYV